MEEGRLLHALQMWRMTGAGHDLLGTLQDLGVASLDPLRWLNDKMATSPKDLTALIYGALVDHKSDRLTAEGVRLAVYVDRLVQRPTRVMAYEQAATLMFRFAFIQRLFRGAD